MNSTENAVDQTR